VLIDEDFERQDCGTRGGYGTGNWIKVDYSEYALDKKLEASLMQKFKHPWTCGVEMQRLLDYKKETIKKENGDWEAKLAKIPVIDGEKSSRLAVERIVELLERMGLVEWK